MYMKITQMTDLNNGIIDMHMAYGKSLSNYFTSGKCSQYLQMIVKIKFEASEAPGKGIWESLYHKNPKKIWNYLQVPKYRSCLHRQKQGVQYESPPRNLHLWQVHQKDNGKVELNNRNPPM